jgi:ribose-phosphate pyrophosphokinase
MTTKYRLEKLERFKIFKDTPKQDNIMEKYGRLMVFDASPEEHQIFSKKVCKYLNINLAPCKVEKFKDGDTNIIIDESVRGADVFVFQSYVPPIGERKYELELLLDAILHGGGANRVHVILPFLFGSRGERRTRARQPIPALVFGKSMRGRGVQGIVTIDVHTTVIGSLYNALGLNFENLQFEFIAANLLIDRGVQDFNHTVLGSVDIGGAKKIKKVRDIIAKEVGTLLPVAFADKYRPEPNVAEINTIVGDVKGKTVYLIDDMGDTLGSLYSAAKAYKNHGAEKIYVILSHPVLGQGAEVNLDKIFKENLVEEIYFGNTIPMKDYGRNHPKIKQTEIEPFVGEAIRRIHHDISISGLHKYREIMKAYAHARLEQFEYV